METYEIDNEKIKDGLNELMKYSANQIFNFAGPFTLAHACTNYAKREKIAREFGIDTSGLTRKIEGYLGKNFGEKSDNEGLEGGPEDSDNGGASGECGGGSL